MIRKLAHEPLSSDPLWYKDAVIYELRVRSFNDSNGDGVGDFKGLTEKLDYLADLGVTTLWLLPFYPSPGKDDGYDIAEYFDVSPEVGTIEDFKVFLDEAHRRGLRVITELVINHTSDQHPWFQRARRAPKGSPERDFYVWSDTPDRYRETRIIFKDFEHSNWAWDPIAHQYYWHRFYSHQPDLNFDNPEVHEAVARVVDFWLGMGVDGLRLDAVPYLYEREGTNCENLPETHEYLRKLRRHVDEKFEGRMLLAEANQWPEDAAAYFGDGDECHMNFHFPIMPRIFMSIHQEDRFPIIDILAQTPQLPEKSQWALFLRNHDELTLEMVTDEERDYMYGAYAHDPTMRINLGIRRRLAPLVGNNRRNIELMNALLFSLPGTPVLYYGDEIGMGDNVYLGDRNGVRTPMQWSADRNAGFSRCNPQRLILPIIIDPEYHFESVNVEAQQNNPNSLLWWTKRIIAMRKRFQAFGRGTIEFLHPENSKVLAFVRRYDEEAILVVANLSRFTQFVELDLKELAGMVPVELFGRTEFPPIGELPYLLTLGGHGFYWFSLKVPRGAEQDARAAAYVPPAVEVSQPWESILTGEGRGLLEQALPRWLSGRRWCLCADRQIRTARVTEVLPLAGSSTKILLVRVDFAEGEPEQYLLPLAFAPGEKGAELRTRSPQSVVAILDIAGDGQGVLFDALADAPSCTPLLEAIAREWSGRGASGELKGSLVRPPYVSDVSALEPRVMRAEEGNGGVAFGDAFYLKVFRRPTPGTNPELEMGRFLATGPVDPHTPLLVGALEYRVRGGEPTTLATLHPYLPNEGDARQQAREELGRYYERVLTQSREELPEAPPERSLLRLSELEPSQIILDRIGNYLETGALLGLRLGQLHVALAAAPDDPVFAPEPYSAMDQRSTYQTMRNTTGKVLRQLRSRLPQLSEGSRPVAQEILDRTQQIYDRFAPLLDRKLTALRGRHHGNLDLSKILYTGRDYVITDFEGDRSKPLTERRRKRSPLRDVSSMVRAFQRQATVALYDPASVRTEDRPIARPWAQAWWTWVSATFLREYLATAGDTPFVPKDRGELALLIDAFTLEIVLAELGGVLDENPARADVALQGLLHIIDLGPEAGKA